MSADEQQTDVFRSLTIRSIIMNLPPQNYQGATPDQQVSSFPLNSVPPIIRNAIIATCVNKKVPVEIVVSSFLSAASLACLPLVEAIPVHTTTPEPAVLNFLVIARSGTGKSTVLRSVMQVFHDFSSEVNDEYKKLQNEYSVAIGVWEETRKALARNLRQAISRNYGHEDANKEMKEHLRSKPQMPVQFKFLHQDFSNGELLKNLTINPEGGVFHEEAVTFFKSRSKNDPGIFNLGWDGSPYLYQRDGVDCNINLRLMFCLMTQPDVFNDYITKYHSTGRGSGFLARFLITVLNYNQEYSNGDFSDIPLATEAFDNRVKELLELTKKRFYYGISDKQKLTLSPQAIEFMGVRRAEMQRKIKEGGQWEHIDDFAMKSGANALRIATIFRYFSGEQGEQISYSDIEHAHEVVDWYMQQASMVFYQNSRLFQFEKDVLEVYHWLHDRMMMEGRAIIAKSEIMRCGPKHKDNNLRLASKLEPILNQLAWQKRIQLIQNYNGGPVYIILPNSLGYFQDPGISLGQFPNGCRWLQPEHRLDMVELILPNLTFSW